jgi:hypothetical protein
MQKLYGEKTIYMIDSMENDFHWKKDMSHEQYLDILDGKNPDVIIISLIWDITAFEDAHKNHMDIKNQWFKSKLVEMVPKTNKRVMVRLAKHHKNFDIKTKKYKFRHVEYKCGFINSDCLLHDKCRITHV